MENHALREKIKEMQARTGLGIEECKQILRKEIILDELDRAATLYEVKRVVRQIIERKL